MSGVGGRCARFGLGPCALIRLALLVTVVSLLGAQGAQATPPPSAIRYVYDADGQLKAVIEPASETALYTWDPAGNLLSIVRHSSSALSLIQMTPAEGPVGETVTISGTGFSATASEDTVKFNGTTASVSSATATQLTVLVPSGATSGPVTVQTASEGPVTSTKSFIVGSQAPVISSVSTSLAAVGAEVTVSGSHFEPTLYGNLVTVNRARAEVVSASSTSITFKVPEATGGRVSVETPVGSATGPDLFIPPDEIPTSEVSATERISIGGSLTVKMPEAERVALTIFDATAGQRVSMTVAESTIKSGHVSIWGPEGVELTVKSFSEGSGGYATAAIVLPVTGTYTILLEPGKGYTGNAKLALPATVLASITPSEAGASQTVATTQLGQKAEITFAGTEGERVFLESPESTYPSGCCNVEVALIGPTGTTLASSYMTAKSVIDTQTLPSNGTYTIYVNPVAAATGSIKLTAFKVPANYSAAITLSEAGASQTVKTTVPGQNGELTFSGTSGGRVFVNSSEWGYGSGCCVVKVSIKNPEGAILVTKYLASSEPFIDTQSLSSTGTYTIYVDPVGAATGSIKLTTYQVPANFSGSITPSEAGASKTVKTTVPGQNGELTFSGTAGGRISLNSSEWSYGTGCCNVKVTIKTPEGATLVTQYLSSSETFVDAQSLPSTGTYTIIIDPQGLSTGSLNLTAYAVPEDVKESITIGGATVKPATTVPGQNAKVTFTGPASKGIKLTLSEVKVGASTCCSMHVSIQKPEAGGNLVAPKLMGTSGGTIEATLTVAGTYTIFIDPAAAATGSLKLKLADPPPQAVKPGVIRAGEWLARLSVDPFSGRLIGSTRSRSATRTRKRTARTARLRLHRGRARPTTSGAPARTAAAASMTSADDLGRRAADGVPISSEALTFRPGGPNAWTPPRDGAQKAWVTNEPSSPWTRVAPLRDSTGSTAIAGQVLAQNGLPLAGVHVAIKETPAATVTDRTGRFLLSGPVPSGRQVLVVEGEGVPGHRRYGSYEVGVRLHAHRTTILPYTIWLTPLDRKGDRHVDSPTTKEERLTTPQIPGLEVRLPAGSVITDPAGHTITDLNITAIPVDRPPFPLPAFVTVPLYFTVQPGRAYLSKGAQIVYPNWGHLPPGQRVGFWNYDADKRGWYVYGKGTVTPNGQQVVPDANVRIWEFSGAMMPSSSPPPPRPPKCEAADGEPVELGTGLFVYHKTDLVLPDTIPIVIERTYRQSDSNSYSFGIGMTNLYDARLYRSEEGTKGYKVAYLILPDGNAIRYVRTSAGEELPGAEYRATSEPGAFYGSTIKYNGSWELHLTNGLTYIFPLEAPLSAIRDRFGNQLTIKRDAGGYGNITQITSPHGAWVKFTNDSHNRVTEITDNGGRHLKYSYNSAGLLDTTEDAMGRTTSYGYNSANEMTSVTDGRGNTYLKNEYDSHERVSKQTLGGGGVFSFAYTEAESGQITAATVTDPRKAERVVTFNSEGFLTSDTRARGTSLEATTTYEPQAETGLLLSRTDPLGRKTAYTWNSDGDITKETALAGTSSARSTAYTYEPGTDELTSATDALKDVSSYHYGVDGERLSETDPLGNKTTHAYDTEGNRTSTTNAVGETTHLAYQGGQLTAVTDPLGRTTKRFVDALGRPRSVTEPDGRRQRREYDPDNELTKMIDPLGAETGIEYDGDGDLTGITDPNGHKTSASYDALDRPESETDALGHTKKAAYDGDGNLVESVDGRGKIARFIYDALNRRTEARYGVSGESAESTTAYGYDAGDRLSSVVDSATGTYTPEYDEFNDLKSLATPGGTISYAYDEDRRRTSMTVPEQEPVKYTYDGASRLTELKRGSQAVSFTYDPANRPTAIVLPDAIEELYGYNEADEPTAISYKKGTETLGSLDYAYSADGEREAVWGSYARTALPEAFSSATYNEDNAQTERGTVKQAYDAAGNLVSDGGSEYKWNARDQLVEISGAMAATFTYDPFGRRVEKKLGGTATKVLYDGANVAQEVHGGTSTYTLTGLAPDQVFARGGVSATETLLTDALGSTIGLASATGKVESTYSYDPFGSTSKEGATSDNPFEYVGREDDGDGLYNYRARYYRPAAASFISSDAIGAIHKAISLGAGATGSFADLNSFAYANDNPINDTDPSGYGPCPKEIGEKEKEVGEAMNDYGGGAAAGNPAVGEAVHGVGEFMEAAGELTKGIGPTYEKIRGALHRHCEGAGGDSGGLGAAGGG